MSIIMSDGPESKLTRGLMPGTPAEPSTNGEHEANGDGHPVEVKESPHLTDRGNSDRLVRAHGQDLRYCWPWKKWLHYIGGRWAQDQQGAVVALAKETIRNLYRRAAEKIAELEPEIKAQGQDAPPEKVRQLQQAVAVLKFCLKSEAAPRLNAMVELARSELGIPVQPADLDRDPWVLNCPNGTVNLRDGVLWDHRREDLVTQLCPTPYDPRAEAPRWCEFLREVFDDDAALIVWVQRWLGYCLTGDVREQLLPIWWGGGANGKSTLVNAVQDVLGEDFAIKANRDLFLSKKQDSHPAQVARLFKKRLVVCTETSEGARLDEVLVKELTGGDKIAARRMREDWWEFWPEFKAILITNHRPEVRGSDHAIWRRLRLIPFAVTFMQDKQDKELGVKLRAEAPGILRWMVEGCLSWQREGLGCPDVVMAATKEYQGEQDRLATFLADGCQFHQELRVRVSELYGAYQSWCKRNGEEEMTGKMFGTKMRERGIRKDAGDRWYIGIALRQDQEEGV